MLKNVRKESVWDDALIVKSDRATTYGDKLLVSGVLAVGGEHGDQSLLSVKSLQDLVESLNKSYSVDNSHSVNYAINPRADHGTRPITGASAGTYRH